MYIFWNDLLFLRVQHLVNLMLNSEVTQVEDQKGIKLKTWCETTSVTVAL